MSKGDLRVNTERNERKPTCQQLSNFEFDENVDRVVN